MALSGSFHRIGFLAFLVLVLAAPALATTFSAQEIAGLSGTRFRGFGMNNHGDVVGVYKDSSNATRGFLYSGGSLQQLQTSDNMGMNYDYEMAINDSGRIAGKMAHVYTTDFYPVVWSSPGSYAFLTVSPITGEAAATSINNANQVGLRAIVSNHDSSIITPGFGSTIIEPAGHNSSSVLGIADSGRFVAQATNNSSYLTRGVVGQVNSSGVLLSLTAFDAFSPTTYTRPAAINSAGQCVGYAGWPDGSGGSYPRAFLREADGTILALGGGVRGYATSINGKGYVVGSALDGSYVPALFGQTGTPQSLQSITHGVPAGLTMSESRVINNNGQILVTAKDSGGLYHTLLLTPDPIQNTFFEFELGAWQAHVPNDFASVSVVFDSDTNRHVCQLVTGSPVGISQQAPTPASPFAFTFDYKAEASVGVLSATINGTEVGSLDLTSVTAGQWLTADFTVTNPDLLGLLDATVAIQYDADRGSTIYLDNFALTSIPEPASLALLTLGALAIMRRRHARGSLKSTAIARVVCSSNRSGHGLGSPDPSAVPRCA